MREKRRGSNQDGRTRTLYHLRIHIGRRGGGGPRGEPRNRHQLTRWCYTLACKKEKEKRRCTTVNNTNNNTHTYNPTDNYDDDDQTTRRVHSHSRSSLACVRACVRNGRAPRGEIHIRNAHVRTQQQQTACNGRGATRTTHNTIRRETAHMRGTRRHIKHVTHTATTRIRARSAHNTHRVFTPTSRLSRRNPPTRTDRCRRLRNERKHAAAGSLDAAARGTRGGVVAALRYRYYRVDGCAVIVQERQTYRFISPIRFIVHFFLFFFPSEITLSVFVRRVATSHRLERITFTEPMFVVCPEYSLLNASTAKRRRSVLQANTAEYARLV